MATEMRIVRNMAECKLCGDVIESKYRWHCVGCSCGEIYVDGGTAYLRRGATDLNNVIELSEWEPDE